MKLGTTTSLFTLFLLSAALTTPHLPSATAADFIVDQDGRPLQNGGSYYVVSAVRGYGGGLTLAKTGNETCPVSVVQSPFETSRGLAVRISSPYRIANIYDGLILSFAFNSYPDCAPTPSRWTVVKAQPEGLSVKLSGFDRDPVDGWFIIATHGYYYDHDYTIKFCPVSSDDECADIAVHVDENGVRTLVVTDDKNSPFIVQFRKARHHHAFVDDA